MAKIPIADFNQTIQGQISSVDTSIVNRGTNYEALSKVGNVVAGIGETLLKKRYKAETDNAVFNAVLNQKLSMSEFENQEKLRNPDGKDYRKNIDQYGQRLFKQNLDQMPNDDAKEMFNEQGLGILGQYSIESDIYENKAKADKYEKDFLNGTATLQNAHVLNPKPLNFESDVNTLVNNAKQNAGVLFPVSQLPEYEKAAKSGIAEGILDGLYNKKQYASALGLLKKDQKISSSLTPDKYAGWVKRLEDKMLVENNIKVSELNQRKSDFEYMALTGKVNSQSMKSLLVDAKGRLKPSEFQIFKDEMEASIQAGSEVKKMNDMSLKQLTDYSPQSLVKGEQGAKYRGELQGKIQKAKQDILNNRKEDINEYVGADYEVSQLRKASSNLTNPEATQQLFQLRETKAKVLGAPYEVLSKQEVSMVHQIFDAPTDSVGKAKVVEEYQKAWGDKAPAAFAQVFKNKADVGYLLMGYVPSTQEKVDIYNAVKNGPEIRERLGNDRVKTMNDTVEMKMAPWLNSITGSSPTGDNAAVAQAMKEVVSVEALKMNATGTPMGEAVNKSFSKMIAKNFIHAEAAGSSGVFPRRAGEVINSEEGFNNFFSYYKNKDNLKALDPMVGPQAGFTFDALVEFGEWKPSGNGVTLVVDHPSQGVIPVRNSKGEIITKSYKDISLTPFFAPKHVSYKTGPE